MSVSPFGRTVASLSASLSTLSKYSACSMNSEKLGIGGLDVRFCQSSKLDICRSPSVAQSQAVSSHSDLVPVRRIRVLGNIAIGGNGSSRR
ncbi:hypothetical protein SERLADRAFT_462644 [Serpula lacrymans var. lacrymans S7.9]|uniref:Uncharacterized protein n=1 Tax=Serpula lacrymans var. lacrymans (strain S7.9) TaxID=578457 RepID=F8NPC9_SERL9|nr:uncharacterized protein SERLADRAFT_462644 [Serpula lacrymans var. lacrymans S7.9]EGO28121.1 hypothetical protein SERLADRAFT_462644 [Serpula lacrymans var. lacrymans S7.9]